MLDNWMVGRGLDVRGVNGRVVDVRGLDGM